LVMGNLNLGGGFPDENAIERRPLSLEGWGNIRIKSNRVKDKNPN